MRNLRALAVAIAATALLPAAAVAQQATPTPTETQTPAITNSTAVTPSAPTVLSEQEASQVLSDSYIGAKVVARSADGLESVGKVSDLVLGDDDKIVGVVVDVGGFLGVGAKPVGLAWAALTEERADGELMLKTSLSREDLEEAPEFKTLEQKQVESDQQMIQQQQQTPTTN